MKFGKSCSDGTRLPKNTVGKQIVRSADSIGANIAEGTGRHNFQDNQRFVKIARGSLNETSTFPPMCISKEIFSHPPM